MVSWSQKCWPARASGDFLVQAEEGPPCRTGSQYSRVVVTSPSFCRTAELSRVSPSLPSVLSGRSSLLDVLFISYRKSFSLCHSDTQAVATVGFTPPLWQVRGRLGSVSGSRWHLVSVGCARLPLPWAPPVWLTGEPPRGGLGALLSRDPEEAEERRPCSWRLTGACTVCFQRLDGSWCHPTCRREARAGEQWDLQRHSVSRRVQLPVTSGASRPRVCPGSHWPSVCARRGTAILLEASRFPSNPSQGHHCALQREEPADQGTHVPRAEEALRPGR